MATSNYEVAKALIELSVTFEQADKAVEDYLGGSPTYKEKLALLKGMFGCDYAKILGHDDDPDALVYVHWLNSIVRANFS